jgi:hypothetical protein
LPLDGRLVLRHAGKHAMAGDRQKTLWKMAVT